MEPEPKKTHHQTQIVVENQRINQRIVEENNENEEENEWNLNLNSVLTIRRCHHYHRFPVRQCIATYNNKKSIDEMRVFHRKIWIIK